MAPWRKKGRDAGPTPGASARSRELGRCSIPVGMNPGWPTALVRDPLTSVNRPARRKRDWGAPLDFGSRRPSFPRSSVGMRSGTLCVLSRAARPGRKTTRSVEDGIPTRSVGTRVCALGDVQIREGHHATGSSRRHGARIQDVEADGPPRRPTSRDRGIDSGAEDRGRRSGEGRPPIPGRDPAGRQAGGRVAIRSARVEIRRSFWAGVRTQKRRWPLVAKLRSGPVTVEPISSPR